ncbi:hypothetical protein [Clostridium sp.]|uniref:hypothetical protein n=1 Tax=Clostridium sp. TaxID=1506 RepID=UPI003A5BF70F
MKSRYFYTAPYMMHGGKFIAGILVGTAVATMMENQRSTKRRMKKTKRIMRNAADGVIGWMK